ncbi:NERD domain-containing protein [Sutcliffiella horikoshii]|uniref:NERD domain-containing protein n=1 Tax=Sutcliffiella horikoshii TaxID=79883 RepID=A0A5D4T3W8_9BACI|nr:nuclease-related domain-containing protein [Sutcliffiella horikoshii]TYS68856.1 NERD domain-containing protein [Sutcliffiella horikoshii]
MIKKQREKSHKLLTHEAGMRRVPKSHPKYPILEQEHGKLSYGHKGEEALDYFLTFLPNDNYLILNSLRLEDPKRRYFQMDSLLLAPTHCIILDSKYMSGKLEFDESANQLLRHLPGSDDIEKLGDPISQISRQRHQLSLWLEKNGFPPIPIVSLIVLTHNNAALTKTTPSITKKVTFHTNLPNRLKEIDQNIFRGNFMLSTKDLHKLSRTLIKKHTPDQFLLLNHYNISANELITGVICTVCLSAPMIRKRGVWGCQMCSAYSKTAHLEAITDYKLLIGETINNRELRSYLNLPSASVTSKYLVSMGLNFEGSFKNRRYFL